MKTTVILFPIGNISRQLATRILNVGNKVVLYTPHQEDSDVSHSIFKEMRLLATMQPGDDTETLISTQTDEDFTNADVIVLPTLDVLSYKSDKEYSAMLERNFREIQSRGMKLQARTRIVFGGNQSGIFAASEWCKVWPDTSSQVLVVSSLYEASIKVFGRESGSRALPINRIGSVFFSDKKDKKVSAMGKAYGLYDYSSIEAALLYKVVSLILLDEDEEDDGDGEDKEDTEEEDEEKFDELEVLGRCATKEDAVKLKICEGTVAWIPTKDDITWYPDYSVAIKQKK